MDNVCIYFLYIILTTERKYQVQILFAIFGQMLGKYQRVT